MYFDWLYLLINILNIYFLSIGKILMGSLFKIKLKN